MTDNIPPPPGNPRYSEGPSTSSALVATFPPAPLPPPPGMDSPVIPVKATRSMPFLEGEDAAAYDRLLAQVRRGAKPADVFEEIWANEYVDERWQLQRLRRILTHLSTTALYEAMVEILSPILNSIRDDFPGDYKINFTTTETLVKEWYVGKSEAVARVNKLLSSQPNLTMETVKARAFSKELPNIMRIEQLISNIEARCSAILREIGRHRETFRRRLKETADNVEDAEYETVVSS